MSTMFIEDIEVGMIRSLSRVITDAEIEAFAMASGDRNPIHFDEEYAKNTIFKGRIAHGVLTASLISTVIGEQMPGHGSVYLSQTLKFRAPVRPGDQVDTVCTIKEMTREKKRIVIDCVCRVGDLVVLSGEAEVLVPSRAA